MVPLFVPDTVLEKRSMRILGHRTSVALERVFWELLEEQARKSNQSLPVLIGEIFKKLSTGANRASALRVFIVKTLVKERN